MQQDILAQVLDIVHDAEAVSRVLEVANYSMDDLMAVLQPVASPEVMQQLRSVARELARTGGGAGAPAARPEEIVERNGERFLERWSCTVYVGNVPADVSEADVRGLFGRFGHIVHVAHRPDAASSFVTYSTREDAEEAQKEMDQFPVHDKQLKTGWARGQDMRDGEFDRKTGRGLVPLNANKRVRVDTYGGREVAPKDFAAGGGRGGGGAGGFSGNGGGYAGRGNAGQPVQRGYNEHHQAPARYAERPRYPEAPQHQQQQQQQQYDYYANIVGSTSSAPPPPPRGGTFYNDGGRPKVPGIDYDPSNP
jgi:hypothetical protein